MNIELFMNINNKKFIWEFLYKNNKFDNIDENNINNIKNNIDNIFFDIYLSEKNKNINDQLNLVNLNKLVLQEINKDLNNYKKKKKYHSTIMSKF